MRKLFVIVVFLETRTFIVDEQSEERPRRALRGEASVPRDEGRSVSPGEGGREADEGRCRAPGGERRPGAHGSAGRPLFVDGPAPDETVAAAAAGGVAVWEPFPAGAVSEGFGAGGSAVVVGAGADGAT